MNEIYTEDYMIHALSNHVLIELTHPQAEMRCFVMARKDGRTQHNIKLKFTSTRVVVEGDVLLDGAGKGASSTVDLDWFLSTHTSEEVGATFFQKDWFRDVFERRVEMSNDIPVDINAPAWLDAYDPQAYLRALGLESYLPLGEGFPLSETGWMSAIQKRFLELWNSAT